MSLVHATQDPLVITSPNGTVMVLVNEEDALRFRSPEHFANWVEELDRSSLHAFAAEARRNVPQLPLAASGF